MHYTFDRFVLDMKRRELMTVEGVVPLRPKVFGLLAYLIAHRDRVVPKRELFENLWPDVHVGDATLNTCVRSLRQAVGDNGQSQRIVQTKHGHGYRFVAAVEERGDERERESSRPKQRPVARDAAPAEPAERAAASDIVPPAPAAMARFSTGKEHKHVTVLHCTVTNASKLAAGADVEAADEAMEDFLVTAQRAIARYGGAVSQWLSDGVVALFGAPQAYEDHARRAVSAALELQEELRGNRGENPKGLCAGIGIHTGPVVACALPGDSGQIYTAFGLTTETARTLREIAPAGGVLVSDTTFEIVRSEVRAEAFPVESPDGANEPSVYLVHALTARHAGVPRRGRGLTRFVGRDRELGFLSERFDRLKEGGGAVVGIAGEPGIGKSRLVREFMQSIDQATTNLLQANCLSYASVSPYMPIKRLLQGFCTRQDAAGSDEPVAQSQALLETLGIDLPNALPLLNRLMDLPVGPGLLDGLSAVDSRTQTFALLHRIFRGIADQRPTLVVIEDLHWIDPTSEEWLSELVSRLAGMKLLLVTTYRAGYRAPWLDSSAATQIALDALPARLSTALVQSLPAADALPERAVDKIVAEGQGNLFFLEELAWSWLEDRSDLPSSVKDVLADRIDRLTPADKALLRIAAVIGTEVPVDLLSHIDDLEDAEREACLERLQTAEFLYERSAPPNRVLVFRQALAQYVAYSGLVRRSRRAIHRRIADAMQIHFRSLVDAHPELMAHHLAEAGDAEMAILHWRLAGLATAKSRAHFEAVPHFERALQLLDGLERTPDRLRQRISIVDEMTPSYQVDLDQNGDLLRRHNETNTRWARELDES